MPESTLNALKSPPASPGSSPAAPADPAPYELVDAVAQSRSALVRQAKRMLRDDSGAEDAAQDALVAALSHLHYFRGDSQLGTWLYRVGANAVLMTMRRDRRSAQRTQRAAGSLPKEASWLHGSADLQPAQTQLEGAQQAQLLRWAIERLPEHYRCVVIQCDLDEKPMQEVALSLGLSVGGVRTRRLRAHRMLRSTLSHRAPNPA